MGSRPVVIGCTPWLAAAAAAAMINASPRLWLEPAFQRPNETWAKKSRSSQFIYRQGMPRLHRTKGYRGAHKLWRKRPDV